MRALALSAVLLLSMTGAAAGAPHPGTLDRSFGADGRVLTRVAGPDPTVVGLERLSRGKLLLVGTVGDRRLVLIRYRRDGSLDRQFGGDGVRTIGFDRDLGATDTLLDANGRLLVAGSLGEPGTPERAALLMRFDRAGLFDTTLDGDGISLTDFGSGYGSGATAIALTPQGQIVLAATVGGWDYGVSLGVTRLDPSGAIDAGFGVRGFVRMQPHFSFDSYTARAAAVEPGGRTVMAVGVSGPKGGVPYLIALLPDGTPDAGFGKPHDQPGWRILPFPGDTDLSNAAGLVLDRDRDRIVLAGRSPPEAGGDTLPLVSTVGPGAADSQTLIGVGGRGAYGRAIALDRAGRTIVVGSLNEFPSMFAARLTPAGRPDQCFGRRGVAWAGFRSRSTRVAALALTSDGRIVLAGPDAYMTEPKLRGFQLAAFRGGACPRR
jgi:uncharacterized delta-60 repeat protein